MMFFFIPVNKTDAIRLQSEGRKVFRITDLSQKKEVTDIFLYPNDFIFGLILTKQELKTIQKTRFLRTTKFFTGLFFGCYSLISMHMALELTNGSLISKEFFISSLLALFASWLIVSFFTSLNKEDEAWIKIMKDNKLFWSIERFNKNKTI